MTATESESPSVSPRPSYWSDRLRAAVRLGARGAIRDVVPYGGDRAVSADAIWRMLIVLVDIAPESGAIADSLYLPGPDGPVAVPSTAANLGKLAMLAERAARGALRGLEAHGLLTIKERPGRPDHYTLVWDRLFSGQITPVQCTAVQKPGVSGAEARPLLMDSIMDPKNGSEEGSDGGVGEDAAEAATPLRSAPGIVDHQRSIDSSPSTSRSGGVLPPHDPNADRLPPDTWAPSTNVVAWAVEQGISSEAFDAAVAEFMTQKRRQTPKSWDKALRDFLGRGSTAEAKRFRAYYASEWGKRYPGRTYNITDEDLSPAKKAIVAAKKAFSANEKKCRESGITPQKIIVHWIKRWLAREDRSEHPLKWFPKSISTLGMPWDKQAAPTGGQRGRHHPTQPKEDTWSKDEEA